MHNLPLKNIASTGVKAILPLLIISFLSFYAVATFYPKPKDTSKKDIALNINNVQTESKPKDFSFGFSGSVLGLSDTPGYIDFCHVAHNLYTVPLAVVPQSTAIRNSTYPAMTLCFDAAWGTPPNVTKGCNIDTKECKGWAWRYVCDVKPSIAWAVDEDPNMSDADKRIYFNRHCSKLTGSQTDIGVTFSRLDRPSSDSQVYKLDDVGCGKLVQIDVTTGNCEPDIDTSACGHIDDFLNYYTGICVPTPTPSPSITPSPTPSATPSPTPSVTPSITPTPVVSVTPTPTPSPSPVATIACKSLTGVAKDLNNNTVSLTALPENFSGTLTVTCIADATVKPVTSMQFDLNKTLNSNTTTVSKTINGSAITTTTSSSCDSGKLCFKGESTFDISGQGTYSVASKVCNSDNLCTP